jgi:hypothetical protein
LNWALLCHLTPSQTYKSLSILFKYVTIKKTQKIYHQFASSYWIFISIINIYTFAIRVYPRRKLFLTINSIF